LLSCDQVQQDRDVLVEAAGRLGDEYLDRVLDIALARWARRDDTKAEPAVRRAANDAMDAIDATLRELHAMRARLLDEMRASDDATAARADALLAELAAARG
jgi:hypothetical protein